jgi:hypothetical protein
MKIARINSLQSVLYDIVVLNAVIADLSSRREVVGQS